MGVYCVCIAQAPLTLGAAQLNSLSMTLACTGHISRVNLFEKVILWPSEPWQPTSKHRYCVALLASPESPHPFLMREFCLPVEFWMKTPVDRSSVLNSVFCSLLSFHEYKTPSQRGESAGRDQQYPCLMERDPEFIDGKTMLEEGKVQ